MARRLRSAVGHRRQPVVWTMRPEAEYSPEAGEQVLQRKFVRVIERRADGFVAFEFAIGWPELSVELILPGPAFEAFCVREDVQPLES